MPLGFRMVLLYLKSCYQNFRNSKGESDKYARLSPRFIGFKFYFLPKSTLGGSATDSSIFLMASAFSIVKDAFGLYPKMEA